MYSPVQYRAVFCLKAVDVFQFSVDTQWGIQRREPPLVLEQTEKTFFESAPPPILSQGLDDQLPPLSECLDLPLPCIKMLTENFFQ